MNELSTLMSWIQWGFGLCVTGFLFLAGWMWWIVGKLAQKVSYDSLNATMQKTNETMQKTNEALKIIGDALIGTYDKEGLIRRVEGIVEKCRQNHGEK